MKKIFTTLFTIGAMLTVIALVHFVSAGTFVPGSMTPPTTTPAQFLDQSSTGQTKQGWLRLGGSGDPTTTLDVLGTTATTTLGVMGNATVVGKLRIGGNVPPTASDPALVITGGFARSSQLIGVGDRPLCATSTGLIKVCGTTTASTGVCGSANSTTPVASAPTTGLCSTGTASSVTSGTSAYSWTCTLGTTTPTACSVPKITSSTTTCGTVHTTTPSFTLTASSLNLCTGTITPNNFSSTDPVKYTWECWNAATTSSSMCYANKTTTPAITWNSSSCTSTVGIIINPAAKYFITECPEVTYQGNIVTTYEKEINGTVSSVINSSPIGPVSTPRRLGNIIGNIGQTTEIEWGGSTDLKAIRFRPKSGSVLGDWGAYKAYFTPDDPIANVTTYPFGKVQFNWSLSSNENTGSLPKVISYRILACDSVQNSDCVVVGSLLPGTTSTFIPTPVTVAFGQPKPYFTDAGPTRCTLVTNGGNIQCNYYIQAYINTPYLPETTGTSGLVNKLPYNQPGVGVQNKPVYYSSDLIQFP